MDRPLAWVARRGIRRALGTADRLERGGDEVLEPLGAILRVGALQLGEQARQVDLDRRLGAEGDRELHLVGQVLARPALRRQRLAKRGAQLARRDRFLHHAAYTIDSVRNISPGDTPRVRLNALWNAAADS